MAGTLKQFLHPYLACFQGFRTGVLALISPRLSAAINPREPPAAANHQLI